jgi:hypothetical protein
MLGFAVTVGENNQTKWCPFEYEYFPKLCCTTIIIVLDGKSCSIKARNGRKMTIWGLVVVFLYQREAMCGGAT